MIAEPALFDSLTLLGSGPAQLTGPRAELLEHLSPLLEAGGVQLVNDTLEQLAMTDPRAQAVPAPTEEFLRRRFLANSAAGLRGMADAMLAEPDRVAELAATGVPVLVAHGIADDAWSPAAQADMARRLGARHEVIVQAVHSPAIENRADTLRVLLVLLGRPGPDRRRPGRDRGGPVRPTPSINDFTAEEDRLGFFGPDSITWRVHSDPAFSVGGIRALLLQALHPVAMDGVHQFSTGFTTDPWARLTRTAEYVATLTYGTRRDALRAVRRVRGHAPGQVAPSRRPPGAGTASTTPTCCCGCTTARSSRCCPPPAAPACRSPPPRPTGTSRSRWSRRC